MCQCARADCKVVPFIRRLEFAKAPAAGVDAMARSDNLDDYVVYDPLLESAKGKFSKAAQREKKKQTEWAGRGQG